MSDAQARLPKQDNKASTNHTHIPQSQPDIADFDSQTEQQAPVDFSLFGPSSALAQPGAAPPLSPRQVMQLQRTIGNRATAQLIQRKAVEVEVAQPTEQDGANELASPSVDSASSSDGIIQRKPTSIRVKSSAKIRLTTSVKLEGGSYKAIEEGTYLTIETDNKKTDFTGPTGTALKGISTPPQVWYAVTHVNGAHITTVSKFAGRGRWIHRSSFNFAAPPSPAPSPTESASGTPTASDFTTRPPAGPPRTPSPSPTPSLPDTPTESDFATKPPTSVTPSPAPTPVSPPPTESDFVTKPPTSVTPSPAPTPMPPSPVSDTPTESDFETIPTSASALGSSVTPAPIGGSGSSAQPAQATINANAKLRSVLGTSMSERDAFLPIAEGQTITVIPSNPRLTSYGRDGAAAKPLSQKWFAVLAVGSIAMEDLWVHETDFTLVLTAEPVSSGASSASSPTPASTPATFGGVTPDWLTKTGDPSAKDRKKAAGMKLYSAYGTAKSGLKADYMAEAGPEGFDAEAYKHSADVISVSNIKKQAKEGASYVRSEVTEGVREGLGLESGGDKSGDPSTAQQLLATSRELATDAARTLNHGDWTGWLKGALTVIRGVVEPYIIFATFTKSLVGLIDKIMDYKTLLDSRTRLGAKATVGPLAPEEQAVFTSTMYAVPKVKRGIFSRLAKFLLKLGSMIAHIITLVSGGTATLASEAAALAFSLTSSAISVGESAKGLYKIIKGTRGKNRATNAKTLVDAAFNRQDEALTILRGLNPFSMGDKAKTRAKTVGKAVVAGGSAVASGIASSGVGLSGGLIPTVTPPSSGSTPTSSGSSGPISAYPQNNAEMHAKLVAYTTGPKGAEKRIELEKTVAGKLKST
jgi:hypothetical protein